MKELLIGVDALKRLEIDVREHLQAMAGEFDF